MPRSNRRQGQSGRRGNPQEYGSRSGGFEQTGTGYRYDDQQRREHQQYGGESGRRNWPGQEDWRQSSGRSRAGEGRNYGQEYDQGSRFGGYQGIRDTGQQDWRSQGYPQSYRDRGMSDREASYWGREDESRYGRGREGSDYGYEGFESSEADYEGYEPGDYSSGGISRFGSSQRFGGYQGSGGQGRSQGSYGQGRSQGASGQMYRGSSGSGSSRPFGQGRRQDFGSQQYGTSQGSFAGRGPQGYKRSDERITEDINEELTQDADIDASNISVEVQNGEVTLKGTVPDRETKRRSEDIAESCSGVREVQNQLRVKREGESESEARKEKGDDKRSHRQQLAS
jgi:hypothetical protein